MDLSAARPELVWNVLSAAGIVPKVEDWQSFFQSEINGQNNPVQFWQYNLSADFWEGLYRPVKLAAAMAQAPYKDDAYQHFVSLVSVRLQKIAVALEKSDRVICFPIRL